MNDAIAPHGGKLINRNASPEQASELKKQAASLPRIDMSVRELADLEMIASGALSPLEGFMGQKDYTRVVGEGRLASGLPWTIPITLTVKKDHGLAVGKTAALFARVDGKFSGTVEIEELYSPDKNREAEEVYRAPKGDD